MLYGILAGIAWALETIVLGKALSMSPFIDSEKAIILAPFISTFIHDTFSSIWALIYNAIKGNEKKVFNTLKKKDGRFVVLAATIGGPIGMTGYVLTINYLGSSIGAIASAIYPAIGSLLAYLFLKEDMKWYRWVFLFLTLLGVYGLSYSPDLNISNYYLGILGALMCAFGWGIEAVILAKSMKDKDIKDEYCLQIRQSTSAIINGLVLMPIVGGWPYLIDMFKGGYTNTFLLLSLAALFATISYLFYYKAISKIGASKAMALNITYSAWSILFNIIFFKDTSLVNTWTLNCAQVVLICGILSAIDYKDLDLKLKIKKKNK